MLWGLGNSVGAVAAAGVPGLSAVGVSTSLCALGGGSIAIGLTAAITLPAALMLGLGFLVYGLWGSDKDV